MLPLLLCALVGSGYLWAETKTSNRPVFRLHLGQLPESEDPARVRSSSGNFLLQARHRGLLKYTSGKGLEPDIAKCHRPKPLELHCNIQDDQFWSDGSRITAKDVQNSLLRLLDMKVSAPRAHLLFPVRGAREYYSGAKSNPAIWARGESRIVFELRAGEDREFEYHLTHPALAVYSPDKKRFSGYYRDHKLSANKVQLIANPYLPGHESRPDIEFIVIPEDTVALKLFEKGDLDFLRRLPTLFLPQYRGRSELVEFPQVRMDYYGFGPALKENPWLRQLLSENIDFSSLQKLLGSGGLPGCFGLTEDLVGGPVPCLSVSQKPTKYAEKIKLEFVFSSAAESDHRRVAEFLQSEWKKKTGVEILLRAMENKAFLALLDKTPPPLFRKGVPLERPTCLAALEPFLSDGVENRLGLRDPEFDTLVDQLRRTGDLSFCRGALKRLLQTHRLIPTGTWSQATLLRPAFTGVRINELGQMDWKDLKSVQKIDKK